MIKKEHYNNLAFSHDKRKKDNRKYAEYLIQKGVYIEDLDRADFRGDLIVGENVCIDINVIFEGKVELGNNVTIGANCIITDSIIGENSKIKPFSLVEGAIIGNDTFVGPYGRIRKGTRLSDSVQIGNFVEVKNSTIKKGSRINHLSFIGDASLEENVTIGAGTITCNHDGYKTNQTFIGKGSYVGSGSNLIAPIKLGENVTIGAGSTINENVTKGKLVIARARQNIIKNWKNLKIKTDED
jgi:bifunctional UDP-N-acetylglucosamine pyrophosphorylase / glucosamine-1-phosphate N-acetyltransferase